MLASTLINLDKFLQISCFLRTLFVYKWKIFTLAYSSVSSSEKSIRIKNRNTAFRNSWYDVKLYQLLRFFNQEIRLQPNRLRILVCQFMQPRHILLPSAFFPILWYWSFYRTRTRGIFDGMFIYQRVQFFLVFFWSVYTSKRRVVTMS